MKNIMCSMCVWIVRVKKDDVGQESILVLMACTVSSEFGFAKHSLSYSCHQSLSVPLSLPHANFNCQCLVAAWQWCYFKFCACPKQRFVSPKLAVFFSQRCNSEKKTHHTMESILFCVFMHFHFGAKYLHRVVGW